MQAATALHARRAHADDAVMQLDHSTEYMQLDHVRSAAVQYTGYQWISCIDIHAWSTDRVRGFFIYTCSIYIYNKQTWLIDRQSFNLFFSTTTVYKYMQAAY
jgi:hypothetical protein